MGKTNLLDAIHYLSLVRSHLGTIDRLSVRYETSEANLVGQYLSDSGEEERLALRIRSEKPKQLRRNGKVYARLSDHIGRIPLVVISPQDYRLIRGGSGDRRRFLDRLLSQLDKNYLRASVLYERSLSQRNTMLRKGLHDASLYAVLEQQMAYTGSQIVAKRTQFVARFIPLFQELYSMVSRQPEQVTIQYITTASSKEEEFLESLARYRENDCVVGTTTYGTHRDDLALMLGSELMRKVGSEGQNKTFLVGLKFAAYYILAEKLQKLPILLLDDLFDKLDESRVSNIISLVSREEFGQIFVTDTNRKYLDAIIAEQGGDYQLLKVDAGQVKSF